MIELSDQAILQRLRNTEDSTVERKTANDYRDCLKTAVAFCNSLPADDPGIIFVGVFDDGRVEEDLNLDSLQKKVSKEISKVYPPIYPQIKAMPDQDGKEFLAVVVRGSDARPHFSGPSYVRDGPETHEASEEQFNKLIAERNSKAREILKWRGKQITLSALMVVNSAGISKLEIGRRTSHIVVDCNQFYVTLENADHLCESIPLAELEIGFDNGSNRLELRTRLG